MLAGVARTLARQGRTVTVIARRPRRLTRLMDSCGEAAHAIRPLPLDYHDYAALRQTLTERQEADGPFDLVVCWMHATAAEGPLVVARAIGYQRVADSCLFLHVIASARDSPESEARRWATELEHQAGISYRQVILGFQRDGARTRWLRDEEISAGVEQAIESGSPRQIIGIVAPWEERP